MGKLIVVGGHSRRVGKTATIAGLLQSFSPELWTAVKISAHRHGSRTEIIEERNSASETQTGRYLQAGARRAFLLRAPDADLPAAALHIERMLASGENVIAESNRLVALTQPDFIYFVIDPTIPDWKPSSAVCLQHAGALVILGDGGLPPEALAFGGERIHELPLIRTFELVS